jgi:predicted phosphohydrolase
MKLRLLSDLHLETSAFNMKWAGEDVLVIAGDIAPGIDQSRKLLITYLESAVNVDVVIVCGNHDYYGYRIDDVLAKWAALGLERVWQLENESVVLHGHRFCGSTFWTDLPEVDLSVATRASPELGVKDFYEIHDFGPHDFRALHSTSREWLIEELDTSLEPVIVVTHHLPSIASCNPKYHDNPSNVCFFSADCAELITHPAIKLWCHGHTHTNVEYSLPCGGKMLCNPRGHVHMWKDHEKKRENPDFVERLMIEV